MMPVHNSRQGFNCTQNCWVQASYPMEPPLVVLLFLTMEGKSKECARVAGGG